MSGPGPIWPWRCGPRGQGFASRQGRRDGRRCRLAGTTVGDSRRVRTDLHSRRRSSWRIWVPGAHLKSIAPPAGHTLRTRRSNRPPRRIVGANACDSEIPFAKHHEGPIPMEALRGQASTSPDGPYGRRTLATGEQSPSGRASREPTAGSRRIGPSPYRSEDIRQLATHAIDARQVFGAFADWRGNSAVDPLLILEWPSRESARVTRECALQSFPPEDRWRSSFWRRSHVLGGEVAM
ncbi:Uncharacterised protein [Mycobacteroides abscessus subsp. abscessus]|nr:Uncharacterised protein [Mycobacteroides abscessus subsp. abscessus]SLH38515.1 Uncharacterised protein [Mycobacteroides abscessus subsp. abscessus]